MPDVPRHALAKARQLVVDLKYDEALAVYVGLVTADPLNTALFSEYSTVKSQLIDIQIGQYIERSLRHLTEMNLLASKQELRQMLHDPRYDDPKRLERFGFKVYSQNDEDGILAEIFRRIGVGGQKFFEFGAQTGVECNTHFLLHQDWNGYWAEANKSFVSAIHTRFRRVVDEGRLVVLNEFITVDNINRLIQRMGNTELDLLSIDIDFNDYWMFKALDARPRVIVIEFNAKFPPPMRHVVKYDSHFEVDGSDYFGCSLQSLTDMANAKGYTLVGCNIIGVNAFFVRSDLCHDLFATPATAAHLYQPPRYEIQRMAAFAVGHPHVKTTFGNWLNI